MQSRCAQRTGEEPAHLLEGAEISAFNTSGVFSDEARKKAAAKVDTHEESLLEINKASGRGSATSTGVHRDHKVMVPKKASRARAGVSGVGVAGPAGPPQQRYCAFLCSNYEMRERAVSLLKKCTRCAQGLLIK